MSAGSLIMLYVPTSWFDVHYFTFDGCQILIVKEIALARKWMALKPR